MEGSGAREPEDDDRRSIADEVAEEEAAVAVAEDTEVIPARGPAAFVAEFVGTFTLVMFITLVVSLYVNGYNTRAVRAYERVGFETVGTYATILF